MKPAWLSLSACYSAHGLQYIIRISCIASLSEPHIVVFSRCPFVRSISNVCVLLGPLWYGGSYCVVSSVERRAVMSINPHKDNFFFWDKYCMNADNVKVEPHTDNCLFFLCYKNNYGFAS